jgi:DNA-directed RNA polymerase subunit F
MSKQKYVYGIWCEYDMGFDGILFEDLEEAWDYAKKTAKVYEEDSEMSFSELVENALIGYDTYTLNISTKT